MLTPTQLAYCADDIVMLYSELDNIIAKAIAKKIAKAEYLTESAVWMARCLQDSGMLYSEVYSAVAQYANKSDAEIKTLFENASLKATSYDMSIYTAAGLNPLPINLSPTAMQVLEAGYNKTCGNLNNLTMTTANSAQQTFIKSCTLAEMQVTSGAFTYVQAISNAIISAISDGAFVAYDSGHTDRLDVAVRRCVMTGLGQTTGQISLQYAYDMGCDLMEITAHSGARPSHAVWQGQIVSLSGRRGYLSLSDIGYGTGEGFKGWNCRHDWYPYIEGVSKRMYSDSDLKKLEEKNISYNGKMYTEYEIEQKMRSIERQVRDIKRKLTGLEEGIKSTSNKALSADLKVKFDKQLSLIHI